MEMKEERKKEMMPAKKRRRTAAAALLACTYMSVRAFFASRDEEGGEFMGCGP